MSVIAFPKRGRRHGRASAGSIPKTAGSTSLPSEASAPDTIMNFSAGMRLRERQLLTAESPTPQSVATFAEPPRASTTTSTVPSIDSEYSRGVNLSTGHNIEIFTRCELLPNRQMSRAQKDIAYRLELTRLALELTPANIEHDANIPTNAWSQYIDADPDTGRRISLEAAFRLKDAYKLTLDWIFDADRARLPSDLVEAMRKIERQDLVDLTRTRGRPPKRSAK
jgi:hypothetical protein